MTILLGTFGASKQPLCLYTVNNHLYFSIEEINHVFFKNQLTSKTNLIQSLFKAHAEDFNKTKTGQIYVMKNTMKHMARLFNAYCLAELCKLSLEEILTERIIEPLLNAIDAVLWIPSTTMVNTPDHYLCLESLVGNEWIFTSYEPSKEPTPIPMQPSSNTLYQWLSFNLIDQQKSPEMMQTLVCVAKTKKQQQAIIETRQRKAAFTKPLAIHSKKHKLTRSQHKKHTSYPKTSLPPSPPPKKRKLPLSGSIPNKKTTYIMDHGNDNLNLLATQATHLSFPPPIKQENSLRLPSLQTILTELHHPIRF
ncbi:uncharacterized protein B0P05DRAFT_538307 [Gilbertella persicaria]|uniref:uncharacterized protein n=1 Tax=Gilbertella persicaria TaxID=101096 RepID=UPI002220FCCB|nr:uncharacterized protein B0P05DRAFT_538307 [Gilbertella persicaria]KAI8081850.1 hypothetical protein B0P05DRAFT_538307 [Gilbertella persicaria]